MRYLGLDLGTKTLGLSISDKTNTIATPLKTIHFKEENYESTIKDIKEIIEEKKITALILGLPKNMNNTLGESAKRTENFQKLLKKELNIKVHLIDERLTTKEAEKILISTDKNRKTRKKIIDNVASSLILEIFLKKKEEEKNERRASK